MEITSPAFNNNEKIPSKYTCDGAGLSPPLKISNVPQEAKSLVLISDDPDAPMGTWVHWLVWNIDPKIFEITENNVPSDAVQGTTSFGNSVYGGPCPPSGVHRYFFKLYALDTMLDLSSSTQKADLESAMENHILNRAEIIGLYQRQ
ncbi:YbhB/YbcL family Raf kinase inhibitor-like protein [Candidatus Peregrinibacteria bacterium]|nr:YbhB/YbcL family Raf kinase inhibitor-like protein [Candidatus Peregrinibacteria bacterium]